MATIDNIIGLMHEKNIKVKDLCAAVDISTGNFYDWKSGRTNPKLPVLVKIADFFGVTLDYLTNGSPKNEKAPANGSDAGGDDFAFALSGEVNEFTQEEKQQVRDFVKFVRAQRRAREKEAEEEAQKEGK
jgi:transcriptional regulator with XRE-family HTH domain